MSSRVWEMASIRAPQIKVETIWRTVLVTDARNSSKAYFSERADEALIRIERDRALFAQIAAEHGGEETRDRGDGSMFAFCDPIAALRAAMTMQAEIARLNVDLPPETLRIVHRMGIHMGPVKLATTRLPDPDIVRQKMSGDLVVTAARLEEICHPGEVSFSNDVYRAVRSEIEHDFRCLDSTLKGFDRPIRCWSTRLDREWARPLTAEEEQSKQRRRDEKRLREKWEREREEKARRRQMLKISAICAGAALSAAVVQFILTQTDLRPRFHEAWLAFTRPLPTAQTARAAKSSPIFAGTFMPPPVFPVERHLTPTKRATPSSSPRPGSPARVAATLRKALVSGDLEEIPARLAEMSMAPRDYEQVCDDARRVERARDWLTGRVADAAGGETDGLPLDPPVAGFAVLTKAGAVGLAGVDDDDRRSSIAYARLAPGDFGKLLRAAATEGDASPDEPADCARSLAALQRRIGRR